MSNHGNRGARWLSVSVSGWPWQRRRWESLAVFLAFCFVFEFWCWINDCNAVKKRSCLLPIFYNVFTGDPDVICLLGASKDISTNMSTNAISLKLPNFWETSASAWFTQTEVQFALLESTAGATKYYYVVSALGDLTATRVASFLINPPEEEKYNITLKTHLLKAFELSDAEQAAFLHPRPRRQQAVWTHGQDAGSHGSTQAWFPL